MSNTDTKIPRIRGSYKFTTASREACLRVCSETGSTSMAARAAGISASHLRSVIRDDPDGFGAQWEDARAAWVDSLEQECYRRAVLGFEEQRPGPLGTVMTVRKWSDALLLAMLRAELPDRYGTSVRVEAQTQTTVTSSSLGIEDLSPESRADLRRILEREQRDAVA